MYVRFKKKSDQPDWPERVREPNYLRRNIWGIGRFCDALLDLGMGFDSPTPEWPRDLDNVKYEDHVAYDEKLECEVGLTDRGRTHLRRTELVRSTHSECGTPGIPLFKFSSNDGWHVTVIECQQALTIYESAMAAGTPHPDAFHTDTIPFLRLAAEEDGFEVH